jgi:hypothetical protein
MQIYRSSVRNFVIINCLLVLKTASSNPLSRKNHCTVYQWKLTVLAVENKVFFVVTKDLGTEHFLSIVLINLSTFISTINLSLIKNCYFQIIKLTSQNSLFSLFLS